MSARCEAILTVRGSGESVATKLQRIAEKARKVQDFKFTSLYHLMNEELMRGCYNRLRKDAVAGIDKMTKDMYAENLGANLSSLTEGPSADGVHTAVCSARVYTQAGRG